MSIAKELFKSVTIGKIINKPVSGEWGEEPLETDNNVYKIIRTTNFTNIGKLNLNKEVVFRKIENRKAESKMLKYGDIIIEKSGGSPAQPVGRVVFFDINESGFLCNNFTSILRAKESVYPKYLFYFLFYNHITKKTLSFQNKTTGIINLQLERYLDHSKIPLLPFETQKRIAEVLDKTQELIDKRKDQIVKLDELIKSVFVDLFGDPLKNPKGWAVKKLKEVCRKITDGTHHSPINLEKGDFMYITAKNIKKDGIDLTNISYVSKEVHKEICKRCNPEKGDILYIKDGVTTGIAQINKFEFEFSLLSSVALLKINPSIINSYYLREVLNNKSTYNKIRLNMGGAAITRLTLVKINSIEIPIPPIGLQNKFTAIVEQIEQQKILLQESLIIMENNFNSMMQKAFKGELFTN